MKNGHIFKKNDHGTNDEVIRSFVVPFILVVVLTGLPHPPNEENMAHQYIQNISVLSG